MSDERKCKPEAVHCIARHGTCSPYWEPYVGILLAQDLDALSTELAFVKAERDRFAERCDEMAQRDKEHCKDCCCARSWRALGIDEYTGKSIPEHIELLKAERNRLKDALRKVEIHTEADCHVSGHAYAIARAALKDSP
jgi:hypothetical protein